MAARWMQQKLARQRKLNRSRLKGYTLSMGNRKPPNKDVIKEYKERAKGLGIDEQYIDAILRAFWPDNKPERHNTPARIDALNRADEIAQDLEHYMVVEQGSRYKLVLFFRVARDSARFGTSVFVETDGWRGRTRTSIEYRTPFIARTIYQMGQVKWDVVKRFEAPS